MNIEKILILCSALDLDFELGTTPAWWQLMKGLYECGCEVVVAPYRGDELRTLWWKSYNNPCKWEGKIYHHLNRFMMSLPVLSRISNKKRESLVPKLARTIVKPKWKRLLREILKREENVDAVLFLQVPLNHLKGLPSYVKREYEIPIVYFDGDMPVSLPRYGGFTFNSYVDADLTEFDAFIVNSEGVINELRELGADKVHVVHYGADPNIFFPLSTQKDIDIFFSGFGAKFREKWVKSMITLPSQKIEANFVVSGSWFKVDLGLGRVREIPMLPFNSWIRYCCRSKIALNIARESHATVYGTSSSRPFELAALECCVVSNPYLGLETWFEIGREMVIVKDADEAVEVYRWLLSDKEVRVKIGRAARQRVLKEHTFKHRAQQLLNILEGLK